MLILEEEFHAKAQRKKKKAQRFYLAFLASFFAPLRETCLTIG